MSEIERCETCRAPIKIINYALGPELMHYDPAASFPTESKGSAWRYCRTTLATRPPVAETAGGARVTPTVKGES